MSGTMLNVGTIVINKRDSLLARCLTYGGNSINVCQINERLTNTSFLLCCFCFVC